MYLILHHFTGAVLPYRYDIGCKLSQYKRMTIFAKMTALMTYLNDVVTWYDRFGVGLNCTFEIYCL